MQKIIRIFNLLIVSLCLNTFCTAQKMTHGHRYINFISQKPNNPKDEKWKSLFAPSVKKIVNSKLICTNREQLTAQMIDIEKTFGVSHIQLLELLECANNTINVIHFEVTFNDNTTETIIAILRANDQGLIEEINEVFGTKDGYKWQA